MITMEKWSKKVSQREKHIAIELINVMMTSRTIYTDLIVWGVINSPIILSKIFSYSALRYWIILNKESYVLHMAFWYLDVLII